MSYLYNKATAHLWLEFAFYQQAVTRIQIIFTILALEPRRTFFDDMTFFVFQLLA
jgi:hypothetical protein